MIQELKFYAHANMLLLQYTVYIRYVHAKGLKDTIEPQLKNDLRLIALMSTLDHKLVNVLALTFL